MSRTKYTYTIPSGDKIGTETVTLIALTAEEEMMATRRARGDQIRLAFELVKSSLVAVDGKELKPTDGSLDRVWDKLHPQARGFIMQAYGQIHSPKEDDSTTFLASCQIEI